jgi:membrane-associated phospholipid phosphatase
MRISEWIQTGFPLVLAMAAWITAFAPERLPRRRVWTITALGAIAVLVVFVALVICEHLPRDTASIVRDWLPVPLFLIPYWQTGQFFVRPDAAIERRLLAIDQRLLPDVANKAGTDSTGIGVLLETAYLFCYPLVPLGLLAVYLTGLREKAGSFWFVVLVATYLCYAITPFVPALPPRSLAGVRQAPAGDANKGRIFNRWILRHGSIHAISFPSAHAASAFAVAFVLLRYSLPAGLLFLLVAIAISLGAVIGRYHYALDVVLGAAVSLLVFLASYTFL